LVPLLHTPTKYVWNGDIRVARVTGSLSTNVRVQRIRLWAGWNLCSLAVSATNGFSQPSSLIDSFIQSGFWWNSAVQDWKPVVKNDTLAAGTVLWLKASTNATLTVTGTYTDPTTRTLTAGGDFLPSAGLEAWALTSTFSNQPSIAAWSYDAQTAKWHSWLPPPLELASDLPVFIAPGEAVFVRAEAPAELEVADSALRIRYYHQDHLGSSSCISDKNAQLVREMSYYPFGSLRARLLRTGVSEQYEFSQNETDRESLLDYFGARYYSPNIGRFVSVDKGLSEKNRAFLSIGPLNLYAYAQNSPTGFLDKNGREPVRSQATTLAAFLTELRKLEGDKGFKETLNTLGKYPFGGVPENNPLSQYRYIYTAKGGWIDITHLLGTTWKADHELDVGLKRAHVQNSLTEWLGRRSLSAYVIARYHLWVDTVSEIETPQYRTAPQSYWSYEDAPSNLQGLNFFFSANYGRKLSDELQRFLTGIGASNPESAPNWGFMPEKETLGKLPSRMNVSFQPIYTSDEKK
jgi:RHS repeat-associated protein